MTVETESTNCVVCGASDGRTIATGRDYLHPIYPQAYTFFQCSGCEHLYLNPRPRIEEIAKIYPSDYFTFTDAFRGSQNLLANLKDSVLVARFKALGDLPEDMSLLDIGCGDAQFLLALRRRYPKARLAGLDWNFSPAVAAEMRRADIKMIVGTIETADIAPASFDVITMNQLIEHVWDVRKSLERCAVALAPRGILAMETPNRNGWDRKIFGQGWGGFYWPRHLNLFSSRHLVDLTLQSGFEDCNVIQLLAPPCWILSFKFSLMRAGYDRLSRIFSETSILFLGMFAVVDRIALLFGAETSNQKVVARKNTTV